MCSWRELITALALLLCASAPQAGTPGYPGVGRAATRAELAAWDIDVRADFKGLPPGSGSVAAGQALWEARCATCHGFFGESAEMASPIVGGVTADDLQRGRVARLRDADYPVRTTFMKLATLSTLWDYIRRAMPWKNPKSLSVDEVYAATAYLLNLSGIVPDDFTLSERNIREVQQRMPNRLGMSTAHSLWPGADFPGARRSVAAAAACLSRCAALPRISSSLPDAAP